MDATARTYNYVGNSIARNQREIALVQDAEFLAERLRRGDQAALEQILRQLAPLVRARLKQRFGSLLNSADLDDVLSTTLYRLWTYRHHYDQEKGAFTTWFYLIARSAALDFLRKERPHRHTLPQTVVARPSEEKGAPNQDLEQSQQLTQLDEVFRRLPDLDRQILMHFAASEGKGNWAAELAASLCMPASTIRARKLRLLDRLRSDLRSRGIVPK